MGGRGKIHIRRKIRENTPWSSIDCKARKHLRNVLPRVTRVLLVNSVELSEKPAWIVQLALQRPISFK